MSDLFCRKTFAPCQTPSMCSPYGGCADPAIEQLRQEIARLTERCDALEDRALAAEQNQWHAQERCDAYREAPAILKRTIDYRLNEHLCEMKPNYDDSITGFNEAWDIVSKVFDAALASPAGEQKDKTT